MTSSTATPSDFPHDPSSPSGLAAIAEAVKQFFSPMAPAMAAAGVAPPEANPLAMPEIYLAEDVNLVAGQLADLMRAAPLYRMDKTLVTIEEDSGRTEVMSPARFVTWSGERAKFYTSSAKGGKNYKTMTEQMAKLIIVSNGFRDVCRPVKAVHRVRLPVIRDYVEGEPLVELLPLGYDKASGIYTIAEALEFREDLPVEEAVAFFRSLLQDFPWGDVEQGMGNQLAYMLTHFCRGMVAPAKCPIFAFMANLPGSGKGLLANMGLYPVFGKVKGMSLPEPVELKKLLDMAAQVATPYLFFDNLPPGTLKSPLLEAWATMDEWSGRVIGTGLEFEMPAHAVLVMTGNGMKLGPDLTRRSLFIDLFAEEGSGERPAPKNPLTTNLLRRPHWRKQVLAALWSLVRHAYSADGLLAWEESGRQLGRPLESFEDWSAVVPLIVMRAGFADPLTKVVLPDSGDVEGEDGRRTIHAALTSPPMLRLRVGERASITCAEMVSFARLVGAYPEKLDTIENICVKLDGLGDRGGWKEQEWPDGEHCRPRSERERREQAAAYVAPDSGKQRGTLSSLGYHLKKFAGRKMHVPVPESKTKEVRTYQWSSREASRQSTYVVTRLE